MSSNNLFDSAKNFLNKAKDFVQEKLPGISGKPDIVIESDDDLLQSMEKIWNSIKIQFKELGERISKSNIAKDVKKEWAKGLPGKMFVCICAIPAAPVILIGLYIESLVESINALVNVYNESMKALRQE